MKRSSDMLFKLQSLVRRLLASWLNEDDTEPPHQIDRLINKAQAELARVRDDMAAVIVQEQNLSREYRAAAALTQSWDHQAEIALRAGNEAQARQALAQKISYIGEMRRLETELAQQRQAVVSLSEQIGEIRQHIEAARRQRELLDIRQQRIETDRHTRQVRRRGGTLDHLDAALKQAGEWSAAHQDALQVAHELEQHTLEAQLSRLRRETDLDAELNALRARLEEQNKPG